MSATSPDGLVVRRVRFVSPSATSRAGRTFKHPRLCTTAEEPATLANLSARDTIGELFVVLIPKKAEKEWEAVAKEHFHSTDDPDALAFDVKYRGDRIVWRPGLATVYLNDEPRDELLPALTEFAFYEAELRKLEAEMDKREVTAQEDVPYTQTIHKRDKAHWPRLTETIEAFCRMRLVFARLSPRLTEEANSLGPRTRRLASRLLKHARAESRSESLDTRLEACEDLYEGANDRVADVRGWAYGHFLEIIIVVLLLMEVILLCVELVVRAE